MVIDALMKRKSRDGHAASTDGAQCHGEQKNEESCVIGRSEELSAA
jgi:hypothetical protein